MSRAARSLRECCEDVMAIYASPTVRAVQTAEILALGLGFEEAIEIWPVLGPDYHSRAALHRLGAVPSGTTVALVGHEPQMTEMALALMGHGSFPLHFPKGGVASFRSREGAHVAEGATFEWLFIPKLLQFVDLEGREVKGR